MKDSLGKKLNVGDVRQKGDLVLLRKIPGHLPNLAEFVSLIGHAILASDLIVAEYYRPQ